MYQAHLFKSINYIHTLKDFPKDEPKNKWKTVAKSKSNIQLMAISTTFEVKQQTPA